MRKIMSQLKEWIAKNTVRITALASAIIALGLKFEWWTWDTEEVALVMGLLAAFLAFFVSGTVTANIRIGDGSVWGGLTGKTVDPGD
jgi:hypothetical protein